MLDTGSSVNFVNTKKVGRIAARFNLEVKDLINEVADDIAVYINSMSSVEI